VGDFVREHEVTGETMLRDPIFITDQLFNEWYNPAYEKPMFRIGMRYNTWAYLYCLMGH